MSARKKPALPETFSMNEDVPNPFGHAIMGILQAKMLEIRSQFPSIQLKAMYVMESDDNFAHTQFQFVDLERMGANRPYVTVNEYYKNDESGHWRFFDVWLHTDKTEELFVEAVDEELYIAAGNIWAHLMPQALKK